MVLGSKKKEWQKHEEKVAIHLKGGKRVKGSGAGNVKGDIRSDKFIVECKSTKFKSFSITERLLEKLEEDSFGADKIPILSIELENGKRKFYVITEDAFEELNS